MAIDRTSKFVYTEAHEQATAHNAACFLKNVIFAVPYKIHTLLTDNGLQFSLKMMKRDRNYQTHAFKSICEEFGIEHRLTKFYHPWTNGQVERMNRTLKEATVKKYHYETKEQFISHLNLFVEA